MQGVPFFVSPSTTVFPHKKPAFAGTFRDSCGAEDSNVRNVLDYIFVSGIRGRS
jgi:hypothetical protein